MDAGRRGKTGTEIEILSLLYKICLKSDHRSGSAEGSRPSAGVWGVPSFSFSSLAAAGGKESFKSAPVGEITNPGKGLRYLFTLLFTFAVSYVFTRLTLPRDSRIEKVGVY